jgi:hypothetical protein
MLIIWENFLLFPKGTATQICYAFLISHIQALITMNASIIIYKRRRREGDYVVGHSKVTY